MEVFDHPALELEMFPMDVERREISVLFDFVSAFQLIQVVEFYNQHKPCYWNCIEFLNRANEGFKIVYGETIYNEKQLRWYNKRLLPHVGYEEFNCEETLLLYRALCHVFGKKMIILQDFY